MDTEKLIHSYTFKLNLVSAVAKRLNVGQVYIVTGVGFITEDSQKRDKVKNDLNIG